ncbi:MAG: hypothetical protein R2695_00335 [Acidimicrobiales bacterium]
MLVEAGDGVGGTWFWNRYPGARFDSESYTYGYLFSRELFDEWVWRSTSPNSPTSSATSTTSWIASTCDATCGSASRSSPSSTKRAAHGRCRPRTVSGSARFLVAATGVLSVPFWPEIEGRNLFRGQSLHTGRWPTTPVDFRGKRVAVIGTGSSGVQRPAIADELPN